MQTHVEHDAAAAVGQRAGDPREGDARRADAVHEEHLFAVLGPKLVDAHRAVRRVHVARPRELVGLVHEPPQLLARRARDDGPQRAAQHALPARPERRPGEHEQRRRGDGRRGDERRRRRWRPPPPPPQG